VKALTPDPERRGSKSNVTFGTCAVRGAPRPPPHQAAACAAGAATRPEAAAGAARRPPPRAGSLRHTSVIASYRN